MCHAGDGERAVIVVLYTNDAVLLRHQVSIFDDPDALRLWCLTVCRCNRHLPTTVYRLNGPCLRNTRWQVQMQAVALFCIDITIKRDYASIHRADTTTINSPGQPFVAQPNDVTWLRILPSSPTSISTMRSLLLVKIPTTLYDGLHSAAYNQWP